MINARYVDSNNTTVAWETIDGGHASAMSSARDVLDYLAAGGQIAPYAPPVVGPKEQAMVELAASDKEMARIAEDLIQTLISKDLITESDIPQSAHDKMARRAELRSRLA